MIERLVRMVLEIAPGNQQAVPNALANVSRAADAAQEKIKAATRAAMAVGAVGRAPGTSAVEALLAGGLGGAPGQPAGPRQPRTDRGGGGVAGLLGLGGVAGTLAPFLAVGFAAQMAGQRVSQLARTMTDFAGLADPAGLRRYNDAWRDVEFTIGRRLTPVLDLATEGTRAMGDVLAGLLPTQREVRDTLQELRPLFDDVGGVFTEVGRGVKAFGSAIVDLVRLLGMAEADSKGLSKDLITQMVNSGPRRSAINDWARSVGIPQFNMPDWMKAAKPGGKADVYTGPANLMGLQDYGNKAILAGIGASDPARQQVDLQQKTNSNLEGILAWLQEKFSFLDFEGGLPPAAKNALTGQYK